MNLDDIQKHVNNAKCKLEVDLQGNNMSCHCEGTFVCQIMVQAALIDSLSKRRGITFEECMAMIYEFRKISLIKDFRCESKEQMDVIHEILKNQDRE